MTTASKKLRKTKQKNSKSRWNQSLSLEFCHVTHLQDLEKHRGPVRSLNSENDKMNSKHLKTIKNFTKNLAKIIILLSSEPYHCLQRPLYRLQSLNSLIGS